MRKNCLILLSFVCSHVYLKAQDLKINKQYITAPNLINPAFTGNERCLNANLIGTFQWLGLTNAPRTYLLDVQKGFNSNPFESNSKHGLGLTLYSDLNGPFSFKGIRASYAFHAILSKIQKIRLSLGLSATTTWYSLNQSMLFRNTAVMPDNPALNYSMNNSIIPNMAVGGLLYVKKVYLGFSALNLLPLNPSYEQVSVGKRSYYIIAGYKAYLTQSDIHLEPILMYNMSNNGIQVVDVSLKTTIKQKLGLGVTYRHSLISIPGSPNSLAVRLSFYKNHWTYTYVYDLGFNSLQFGSFGNHEIAIGYRLCGEQKPKCPAY